jgi:hypothetical protein
MSFASGKHAWGISDRSGFRYKLNEMKTEWNGLKVGPDEFEVKHPQLEPRKHVSDPQALKDPSPDTKEPFYVYVGVPVIETPVFKPVKSVGVVGIVTVVT